jgi:hypothetical protein
MRNIKMVVVLAAILLGRTDAMKADTAQVKNLLTQIENKIPENYRYPDAVMEGGNWRKSVEATQLQNLIQTEWPALLTNLQAVAPSDTDKTILFVALQSLPQDNYLQFLNQATGLAQSGAVNKQLLKWALFPSDKNQRGVLDYNYNKPLVKIILQKVKTLYANDPDMVKFCNDVLSGATKQNDETYFTNNPDETRPVPAEQTANQTPKAALLPNAGSTNGTVMPSSQSAAIQQTSTATESKREMWPWAVGALVLVALGLGIYIRSKK